LRLLLLLLRRRRRRHLLVQQRMHWWQLACLLHEVLRGPRSSSSNSSCRLLAACVTSTLPPSLLCCIRFSFHRDALCLLCLLCLLRLLLNVCGSSRHDALWRLRRDSRLPSTHGWRRRRQPRHRLLRRNQLLWLLPCAPAPRVGQMAAGSAHAQPLQLSC
jgi:hypothetical protein